MKKPISYLMLFACIALLFASSCKKTEPDEGNLTSFQKLTDYLKVYNLDLTSEGILKDWIIPASDVNGNESSYYIMDIRQSVDFNICHIEGAHNVGFGNVVTEAAEAEGKTILVACYTGQGAAHAVIALRLSGYPDAKSLKWGMSSWNSTLDKWTSNISDTAIGHANWTTDATATLVEFAEPNLITSGTDAESILKERVDTLLAKGFRGIAAVDVLGNYNNYFINNYWAEADVNTYGHIKDAYRINPLTLLNGEYKYLDPSKTIVTYCWTGQTSSMVTAYLTVLGYDAKSLKFGANGMIYKDLQSHKWTSSGTYNCAK